MAILNSSLYIRCRLLLTSPYIIGRNEKRRRDIIAKETRGPLVVSLTLTGISKGMVYTWRNVNGLFIDPWTTDKKKYNVTFITDPTVLLSRDVTLGIFVNGKYTECRFLMRTFTLEVDNNDDYDGAICGIDVITTVINHLILRKKFYGIWHLSRDHAFPFDTVRRTERFFFPTTK